LIPKENVFMADTALSPRSALAGIAGRPQPDCGVIISELRGLGIATLQARRGQDSELRERIRRHFHLELPSRPALAGGAKVRFVGMGPGHWLALNDDGGHLFSTALRQVTATLASVSDQSSGYAVFRVGGRATRETLAKGFAIDLDVRSFKPGDAATTVVSHIGATIWRREDTPDGTGSFEIAVFRSLAHSFFEWFSVSAAEYGFEFLGPAPK
jgi:sarcosine oxidase subunit gamma